MRDARIKELKKLVQAASVAAARQSFEIDREETGCGRCGMCKPCQESIGNLTLLFRKAMEREMRNLLEAELRSRGLDLLSLGLVDENTRSDGASGDDRKNLN